MTRKITIHWKTFESSHTVVYVNFKDSGEERFFGFSYETKIRRKPDILDPRHATWVRNASSHLHGQARQLMHRAKDIIGDLQMTVGDFNKSDIAGYTVIDIDDFTYQRCGEELFELWQKAEADKNKPQPPHWPLSGRKTIPETE